MSIYLVLVCFVIGAFGGFLGGIRAYRYESDRVIRMNKKELDQIEADLHKDRMSQEDMDMTLENLRTY